MQPLTALQLRYGASASPCILKSRVKTRYRTESSPGVLLSRAKPRNRAELQSRVKHTYIVKEGVKPRHIVEQSKACLYLVGSQSYNARFLNSNPDG
jgi:hypothetical protein